MGSKQAHTNKRGHPKNQKGPITVKRDGKGPAPNRPVPEPTFNQAIYFGVIFQTDPLPPLDFKNKNGTMFFLCSKSKEWDMLKTFVEEAAALASIVLFVGMIAVWAQLIPQL